jgi:8-oxo-dGTP pyrophosphatase MutT (NUDIX family)
LISPGWMRRRERRRVSAIVISVVATLNSLGNRLPMNRDPIPTHFFVLAAVRKEDRFLLVHESKHGQGWYLPAGRVEPGEAFVAAILRETQEEAGIPIKVNGIARLEHFPALFYTRIRLLFTAEPVDNTPPKSKPDEESLGAGWFTLKEIRALPLRGSEVLEVFTYLAAGGPVAPLDILAMEGAPFYGLEFNS